MASDSDPANEKKEYLAEWLRRHKSAESVAPDVQREFESAEWDAQARRLLDQEGAPEEITKSIDEKLNRNLEEVKTALPLPTDYKHLTGMTMTVLTSGTASTSAAIVTTLFEMGAFPGASPKVGTAIHRYEELQQSQGRFTEARTRLKSHFPSLVEYFDLAEQKFQLAKGRVEDIPGAATEMRTLLDKIKGELFAKARRVSHQENMTWSTMAERLSEGEENRHALLLDQETSRGPLVDDLSGLIKRRTTVDVNLLSAAWARVVDHVFVVCGCI